MKIVTAIILSSFLSTAYSKAEVNSTLLSQLTAKGYEYVPEDKFGTALQSIVYILEGTKIVGMGVCLRAATVLVHKSIIGNNVEPIIYIRDKELRASTILKKIENDIALLLIVESIEPGINLDLETVKHIPIYDENEKLHLNIVLYSQDEFDFQLHHGKPGPHIGAGTIDDIIYGFIVVGRDRQRYYEKIGDPLFFQNKLIGILIEEFDESTKASKYLDVACLYGIRNILKHLSPRKGDRNFTVNNRF